MNRVASKVLMVCGISILAACAASPTGERPTLEQRLLARGYQQGEVIKEIPNYRVDGWNSLDDQHLILTSGPSRYYLISLMSYCSELTATETLRFTDTNGRLTPFDKVVVKQPGGVDSNCQISEIRELKSVSKK